MGLRTQTCLRIIALACVAVIFTAEAAQHARGGANLEKSKKIPTVSLSVAPGNVSPGGSVTLSWVAMNATTCAASGAWSGSRSVSGSETVSGINESKTFSLSCSKKKKSGSASVSVSIDTPAPGVLAGQWTFAEKLSKSSPAVNCSNLGSFIVADDASTQLATLRLGGTCVGADQHSSYSWRDIVRMTVSGQSLSFNIIPNLQGAQSCEYKGSIEGSPASRASGTITCADGRSGTWEMSKGSPAAASFDSVASVEVAAEAACALTATGQAYCWGANAFGELGTGDIEPRIVPAASQPGMAFKKLVMGKGGGGFSCGLTPEGAIYCWGMRMKLGDGVEAPYPQYSTTPILVAGGRRYVDVAAGGDHACAVSTDGDAYCWGFNQEGQLGVGGASPSWAPALVAGGHRYKAISANILATCAVAVDGAAYCWGSNISPGDGRERGGAVPARVSGDIQFESISVGLWFVCGVTLDGDGYCWGDNGVGNLGDGTFKRSGGPVTTPVKVTGGLKWKSISAAVSLACGVAIDGNGYCWGGNAFGERGDGTSGTPDVAEPKRIAGDLSFKAISGDWPVCGVTTDGVVYCWGTGNSGSLGDGTMMHRNTPTKVAGQK